MAKQEQSRTDCLKKCNAAGVKLFWHGFSKRLQEEERRKVASRNSVSTIQETKGELCKCSNPKELGQDVQKSWTKGVVPGVK